jgi:hypothetical protein
VLEGDREKNGVVIIKLVLLVTVGSGDLELHGGLEQSFGQDLA